VHIYDFLMARTLEVNIIQDHHIQPLRTGMLLNRTGLKNGHLPYDAATEKRYAREPNKMDSAKGCSDEKLPGCAGCCETDRKLEELSIFGICGHMACQRCLKNKDLREHDPTGCLDRNCGGPANQYNLRGAAPFADIQRSLTTTANSKMDAVVKKVKNILQPKAPLRKSEGKGDAILSFVQFSRVRAALIRDVNAGVRKATSIKGQVGIHKCPSKDRFE
jgi:hypothetical protein